MVKKPINIDEAMTVLNANSLAKSGTDILGEKLPIYFDTWLHGGQSPFATYLVAIMIKLFGYSLFVTRVPMFVFSMLGLVAFYKRNAYQHSFLPRLHFTVALIFKCIYA